MSEMSLAIMRIFHIQTDDVSRYDDEGIQTVWETQSGMSSCSKASFTFHEASLNIGDVKHLLSADLWTFDRLQIFWWSFCRSLGRTNILQPRTSAGTLLFSFLASSWTTQNFSRHRGSLAEPVTRLRARAKRGLAEAETVWWDTTGAGTTFKSSKKERYSQKRMRMHLPDPEVEVVIKST